MGERRQVHRREPIELVLDDGREFIVVPLPWQERNDLGQEIINQNTEAVNEAVQLMVDETTNLPQLELRLSNKLRDPLAVLKLEFPGKPAEDFMNISFDELTSILLAGLEVNQLEHLKHLVDPNSQPPTPTSGTNSSVEGVTENGQKIESSANSSSSDSTETPSENSPMERSSPS